MTVPSIKISFDSSFTIPAPKTVEELHGKIKASLKEVLPAKYAIDYSSSDGKTINITDQTSYKSFLSLKTSPLKLTIRPVEEVKEVSKLEASVAEFELVDTGEAAEDLPEASPKPQPQQPQQPQSPAKDKNVETQTAPKAVKDTASDAKAPAETLIKATNTEKIVTAEKAMVAFPEHEDKGNQSPDKEEAKVVVLQAAVVFTSEDCFICPAAKPNKSCEACKGTGKLRKELKDRIDSLVKEQVAVAVHKAQPRLKLEENPVLKSQIIANYVHGPSKVVHTNKKCFACGATPITGIRYKCTVCQGYDLCESCEAVIGHDHPMIKFRLPEVSPVKSEKPVHKDEPKPVPPVYKVPSTEEPNFCSKCTLCLYDETHVAVPGEVLNVKLKLKNTGDAKWPKDTELAQDVDSSKCVKVDRKSIGEVAPNKEVDIEVKVIAPNSVGKYVIFFQLQQSTSGKKFGQKFWIEVNVALPKASALKAVKEEDKKIEESSIEERKMVILVQKISALKIPEMYVENVMALAQINDKFEPQDVLDLLQKNDNNVEVVANILINQAQ